MLKYYEVILDLGCFTRQDLEGIISNKKTINSLLLRYKKNKFIKRVKQNYYVAMDIVNNEPVDNKYVIASKLSKSNYIAYHSALEYYGYNNQVFNEVTFCGTTRVIDFEFENIEYHFVASKCDIQIIKNYDGVRISTIERTIVDCIDHIDLAGGIEEVYRALDAIYNIDEKKLVEMLDFYQKKVLYQRAGYILETFKDNLKISDSTLDYLKSKIDSSKCYLISSRKEGNTTLDKKWNVCVPAYLSSILPKGV